MLIFAGWIIRASFLRNAWVELAKYFFNRLRDTCI